MDPRITPVFRKISEAYREGYDLIILQGGTGSSKTWSALQFDYLAAENFFYDNDKSRIITIVSYALPHLKAGAIRDFDEILRSFNINPDTIANRTENIYRIRGSLIEFFGVEGNIEKVHGPRRDMLFINEVNRKITFEIFDHLYTRTRELTIIDYNPDREFWLHEKVLPNYKYKFIKSNFIDNPYLSDTELKRILDKKDKPGFENWWRVYGLGELGKLEGAIFQNWRFGQFDDHLPYGYGLDFGFHPDPDALVKVAIDNKLKKIYLKECFYSTDQGFDKLRMNIGNYVQRNERIIADCADKRLINELQKYYNIVPVIKRGTVSEWLKIMQDYEFIVTEESYNLQKEMNNYVWHDKRAGLPMEGFDHLIDAARYYFMDTYIPRFGMRRVN